MLTLSNTLHDEIIVDNFAGGGGASTGIELALGRIVNIAVNHDAAAIRMHRTNHPFTVHYQESIWDVDPERVCEGHPVCLAWFSPDCKHFSKAKGSALVDRKIRGLAWITLRWAGTVRPRVIILENVEEFQTWGPVRKGKPVKSKQGQTFHKFISQLKSLGYDVEYRELIAADYGAPTSRKRFVLIARCDGRPIEWPERTHAPRNSEGVKNGSLLPWRSAAEIIDWSIPAYSVFASKQEIKEKYGVNAVRPLANNTMRRIIRGVDKFTIKSGSPFIVPTGYGERKGQAARVHDPRDPLPTVVSTGKHNAVQPVVVPFTLSNTGGSVGGPASDPVHTIRTAGGQILGAANLIQYHTEQSEHVRANGLDAPLPTVDASNRYGLTTAHLTEFYGNGQPLSLNDPLHTVTSHDREALAAVNLQLYHDGGYHGNGNSVRDPLNTVTRINTHSVTVAHVVEFKGQDRGQDARDPLRTITTSAGEFAVASVRVERYDTAAHVGYWPQIRALLNKHCGYSLADDEIILLWISGAWMFISDISMRMLTPRELYNAMGFPPDYIIDTDFEGKVYNKTDQVARCGNAVCPPMARAVVAANLPEYAVKSIYTMADLCKEVCGLAL